jgi:hypothetical protein
MTQRATLFTLVLLLASTLHAQKDRKWEDGTVKDFGSRIVDDAEKISSTGGNIVVGHGKAAVFFYLIETASHRFAVNTKEQFNFPVGSKTRIAIEKSNAYVIDANGKERRVDLVRSQAK